MSASDQHSELFRVLNDHVGYLPEERAALDSLFEQFDTSIETLRRVYRETEWATADFEDDGIAWQINRVLMAASIPASEPKEDA